VGNAGRSEAGEKGGDIAGIGNGECARRAVVGERETKKRGSDGVSFDVIEGGKTGDKEGKVGGVVVLHTEVVHHQDESDRSGGVAEKTRGGGLEKIKGLEKRDKTEIGQLSCLFEAVHSLLNSEDYVRLSCLVLFEEGLEGEARQDGWRKDVSVNFDELGGGKRGLKVKIGEVNGPKDSIRRDNRVEKDVHAWERSDEGGGRYGRLETVATGCASHTPVDVRVVRSRRARKEERGGRPFFFCNGIVIGGVGCSEVDGAEGAGSFNELNKLVVACPQPLLPVGARHSRAESEGRAGGIQIQYRSGGGGKRGDGGWGKPFCGEGLGRR